MKFIAGFFIKKYIRGSKKGQEYIKNTKKYIWEFPDSLENEIKLGDEVLVETTWLKMINIYLEKLKFWLLIF